MTPGARPDPEAMRALLRAGGPGTAAALHAAFERLSPVERDGWWDRVLGLDDPLPDDGPALPAGGVAYLPCPVDTVRRMVELAAVGPDDVFVDLGSGLGRAAALTHLLTGASAIGVEVQPHLVEQSRAIARELGTERLATVPGDAAELVRWLPIGTVWFLYCPFSGERLERVLAALEPQARVRPLRLCCVDLPRLDLPWLAPLSPDDAPVAVYRSVIR